MSALPIVGPQARCREVMQTAVAAFPEGKRPPVQVNGQGNPYVTFGGEDVWCCPWNATMDKQTPGVDYCIGDTHNARHNVLAKDFDKAVERVRDVFRIVLRRKELELKNLTELSAHL